MILTEVIYNTVEQIIINEIYFKFENLRNYKLKIYIIIMLGPS